MKVAKFAFIIPILLLWLICAGLIGSYQALAQPAVSEVPDYTDPLDIVTSVDKLQSPNSIEELGASSSDKVASLVVGAQRFPQLVQKKWRSIVDAIGRGDLSTVNSEIFELNNIKITHGLEALEGYSLYLIGIATTRLSEGNKSEAAFYFRKALNLSPNSPRVLVASLHLVGPTSEGSAIAQLWRAVSNLRFHPALVLGFIGSIIYPVLWAISFGLFLVFVLQLASNISGLLKECSSVVSPRFRGVLTPLLIGAALIAPLFLGPHWCLAVWAALILIFARSQRWLSFYVGCILVAWGALIPIKETLSQWLASSNIQTMLSVSAGYYSSLDRAELEKLIEDRPDDGVVFYVYGQLLRRLGEYDTASQSFLRSELLSDSQPWTKIQRGMVAFDQDKFNQADQLFSEAERLGANSVEFYFNYSKIKFEQLDTAASRKYLRLASSTDRLRTEELTSREEQLGESARKALAEVNLPLSIILKSALLPLAGGRRNQDYISKAIMQGLSPTDIMLVGATLILWFLFARQPRARSRYLPYYGQYKTPRLIILLFKIIPGGALILSGRSGWALVVLSFMMFMILPLIAWPADNLFILEASRRFDSLYLGGLAGISLVTLIISSSVEGS